jgi:hypothetical protein
MFEFIKIDNDNLAYDSDKVYWHKEYNKFFKLYRTHDDYFEISGLCVYYSDAMTNKQRARVSYNIIKKSILVNQVDKFAEFDGIGWKIREK